MKEDAMKMESKGQVMIYQTKDGETSIEVKLENETVWLTQAQMAELFDVKEHTVTYHIKEVFQADELKQDSATRKIRVVRTEGKRQVTRELDFYNLDMIISTPFFSCLIQYHFLSFFPAMHKTSPFPSSSFPL